MTQEPELGPPEDSGDSYILSGGARRLQNDPIFSKAVQDARAAITGEWLRAATPAEREACWHERQALERVWKRLDRMVTEQQVQKLREQRNAA